MRTIFHNREHAGQLLAQRLQKFENENPIILALPRGGVPLGAEIAKSLNAPLDVIVVRKLGAPFDPEFAIGAIAPNDTVIINLHSIKALGLSEEDLQKVIAKESAEMERRIKLFQDNKTPQLKDKTVIVVDDGLATGLTAQAAIHYLIRKEAAKIIMAAPVCSREAAENLRKEADEFICLHEPDNFNAVGEWYDNFPQITDDEVLEILQQFK